MEAILEAFEEECARGRSVDLVGFLPDRVDPNFCAIAVELIRVDLEYAWRSGTRKRLSDYRQLVPEVFAESALLGSAAFEEFRLRRLSGESVARVEFVELYGIDVEAWPEISASVGEHESTNGRVYPFVSPKVGDRLAGFTLITEIGRGAFARVFLAEESDLARRPVALKITATHSFEPQHLARLQHTNIVPIYSVHESNGLLAVCMPYFGSRTLADVVSVTAGKKEFPISAEALLSTVAGYHDDTLVTKPVFSKSTRLEPEIAPRFRTDSEPGSSSPQAYVEIVLKLVADVAAGLDHAHRRGIIHRDVKPANILVTDDGRPMLLDFNLSDELVVNGAESLAVGGTLPYMAPEHLRAVRSGGNIDARSDLYSLGVIMYELLAGRQPYPIRDGQLEQVIEAMLIDRTGSAPSARRFNRQVSPAVEAIVAKCLTPDREARYGSVQELMIDIDLQLHDLPLKYAANPSVIERARKWRRRHPRAMSLGALAAAVGVMSVIFLLLWIARGKYVARLEAEQQYVQFTNKLPTARMAVSVPDSEGSLVALGVAVAAETLAEYGLPNDSQWQLRPKYESLPSDQRQTLDYQLVELSYLAARGEAILGKLAASDATARDHWRQAIRYNDIACDRRQLGSPQSAVVKQRNELLAKLGRPAETPSGSAISANGPLEQLLQAEDQLLHGEFAAALKLLELLRAQHPTDPVLWLLSGNANAGLGRLQAAEGCYTTAIALQGESYVAYYNRATCRTQLGEYPLALEDFERVLVLEPNLKCVRLNRALAYESAGELRLALADLDAAIAGGDVPPRAYLLRSQIRAGLGDVKGAKEDRSRGLAEEPTDEVGWVARGYARMRDDPDGALGDFRRALALNPRSGLALKNVVYVTADRLSLAQEAMESLDALVALDDSNASALVGRAVLRARGDRRQEALDDLKRALEESCDPVTLFQGACCLSLTSSPENRDGARGLVMLSRALEQEPKLLARAKSDPDLKKLRQLPGYEELMTRIQDLSQLKMELVASPSHEE
ncbi:MAG: protein kinase [Pirellulales bacterium]